MNRIFKPIEVIKPNEVMKSNKVIKPKECKESEGDESLFIDIEKERERCERENIFAETSKVSETCAGGGE